VGVRSLGQMARDELGAIAGNAASVGTCMILIVLISALGLTVVNAKKHIPWAPPLWRPRSPSPC